VLATPVVAVAFCPSLFALRPSQPAGQATADPAAAAASSEAAAGQPAGQQKGDAGGQTGGKGPVQLPYRMVFAVATAESVILYDTQVRLGNLCAVLRETAAACTLHCYRSCAEGGCLACMLL
jgi:hypothetical protein